MARQATASDIFQLDAVDSRTLSDRATDRLREAIRRGQLGPGTRLVERDLAQQLQMSRVPVREAIRRLVGEGLATKLNHRGTFVYAPAEEEIEEISSLRVVLERFVMERVLERVRPEDMDRLRTIVDDMRGVAAQRDFQKLYELDLQFHHTLWEIAAHSLLLEVVSNLRTRINLFLYQAAVAAGPAFDPTTYIEAHENLLDSLRPSGRVLTAGDVARAQEAITQHILASKDRILSAHRSLKSAGRQSFAATTQV
jgi:DNA-binding GntR family transcriptional regulator